MNWYSFIISLELVIWQFKDVIMIGALLSKKIGNAHFTKTCQAI